VFRIVLFLAVFTFPSALQSRSAVADDPPVAVIAVSDWRAASWLADPLPTATTKVLLQSDGEDYGTVNARALAIRHATHVIYLGGDESLLSRMFRERLVMQGARPIDLRTMQPPRSRSVNDHHPLNQNPSFIALFNRP